MSIRFLYTYPQPVIPKTGSAPWSNFNRYGWSIFSRRQHVSLACITGTYLLMASRPANSRESFDQCGSFDAKVAAHSRLGHTSL